MNKLLTVNLKTHTKSCFAFLICSVLTLNNSFAKDEDYSNCRFFDDKKPVPSAKAPIDFVNYISKVAGLALNFKLVGVDYGAKSPIATAFYCNGQRMIGYDANKYFWFDGEKTDWFSVAVLLHEIGHHFRGHLFTITDEADQKKEELEADYFAGFIIESIGGTLIQALQITREFDESYNKTHPPKSLRVEAISNGWRDARMKSRLTLPQCKKSDWIGEEFEINLQICRQFKDCRSGKPVFRVACETEFGKWLFQ